MRIEPHSSSEKFMLHVYYNVHFYKMLSDFSTENSAV